jgi:ribosomal-protein-alanine N-acetyltransferase
MIPGPLVRTMRLDDLDEIMAIEAEIFQDAWTRQSYEYEIQKNKFSLPMVLLLDGKLIGHAVAWHVYNEFHIATLGIRKEYQGLGWGRFLLQTLLGMADGADYVLLEVRKNNYRAVKMYEQFDFVPLRIRRGYYRDGEDAIVMQKQLNQ